MFCELRFHLRSAFFAVSCCLNYHRCTTQWCIGNDSSMVKHIAEYYQFLSLTIFPVFAQKFTRAANDTINLTMAQPAFPRPWFMLSVLSIAVVPVHLIVLLPFLCLYTRYRWCTALEIVLYICTALCLRQTVLRRSYISAIVFTILALFSRIIL